MEKLTKTLEEFGKEARLFAHALKPQADKATLVTLSGDLGAGKTAFTKAVASALGVHELVTSPTFVLEKMYRISDSAFKRLVHIDAYRLKGGAELAPLGFDELMKDPQALVFMEWPERVADTLPKPSVAIKIESQAEGGRKITYEQDT